MEKELFSQFQVHFQKNAYSYIRTVRMSDCFDKIGYLINQNLDTISSNSTISVIGSTKNNGNV